MDPADLAAIQAALAEMGEQFDASEGFSVQPKTFCPHLKGELPVPADVSSGWRCLQCDEDETWICGTCNLALCSRYKNRHMVEHAEIEGHPVGLSLSDLSFWCFQCDSYLDVFAIKELHALYSAFHISKFGSAPSFPSGASSSPGGGSKVGELSAEDASSGIFSQVENHINEEFVADQTLLPYALVGSTLLGSDLGRPLPTLLAVSGEQQRHVSKLFRALRPEENNWQMVVALRPETYSPLLYELEGVARFVRFMRALSDTSGRLLPHAAESGKFHLLGTSNGGATVLAAAALAPELVASLTLVTGFCPDNLQDLSPLKLVPHINMYVGTDDELGHQKQLQLLKEKFDACGICSNLHIIEGAGHFNIGKSLDLDELWALLESMRS